MSSTTVPPDHFVIDVEENHSYWQIIGNPNAPFINSLAAEGTLFTSSYAITRPSEPNYLALLSGSTQGVRSIRGRRIRQKSRGRMPDHAGSAAAARTIVAPYSRLSRVRERRPDCRASHSAGAEPSLIGSAG
jgi:hypothetical protein